MVFTGSGACGKSIPSVARMRRTSNLFCPGTIMCGIARPGWITVEPSASRGRNFSKSTNSSVFRLWAKMVAACLKTFSADWAPLMSRISHFFMSWSNLSSMMLSRSMRMSRSSFSRVTVCSCLSVTLSTMCITADARLTLVAT